MIWFVLTFYFYSIHSIPFPISKVRECEKGGYAIKMFRNCKENFSKCLRIPHMIDGECFPHGTQGPCEEGELFFLDADNCNTKCEPQISGDGKKCSSNQVSYQNECRELFKDDELEKEKRLEVNLHGHVAYTCKREHYVEWEDGSCHLQWFPAEVCPPGQQIRWNPEKLSRAECFRSSCPAGELQWSDGECYNPHFLETKLKNITSSISCEEDDDYIYELYSVFDQPTFNRPPQTQLNKQIICEILKIC